MNPGPECTVYVVEDDASVREALTTILCTAGLHIEAFPSALPFLQRYRSGCAGCLVLDVRLPGMSGLALQDELIERQINLPIVFLTGYGDIAMAVQVVKKGAFDVIEKPFEQRRLLSTVLNALELAVEQHSRDERHAVADACLATLTRREREVLAKVLQGKPTRAIAAELFISEKTVEFHRGRINRKLGVESLAELFRRYFPRDAIPPATARSLP